MWPKPGDILRRRLHAVEARTSNIASYRQYVGNSDPVVNDPK